MVNDFHILPTEKKIMKKRLLCIFAVFAFFLIFDELTGVFTDMHLKNEEQMVELNHNPQMTNQFLSELISDSNSTLPWKRKEAAEYLGKLGSAAKPIVPTLKTLLKDEDSTVQKVAKQALESINHNQLVNNCEVIKEHHKVM